ncbi:hypothetical protein Cni_G10855 [Canna indica]|uniref:DUF7722 domain-containing protein n=1 Tax=Canna indica TaxID=4628 RepID=A0AAQ3Q7P0_9LILI|nr:hypothetical protein Cni_G10855 [Canna indica]
MEPVAETNGGQGFVSGGRRKSGSLWGGSRFQMPLHYPNYSKAEYEAMPECQLDRLLSEYGLPVAGDVAQKRRFAIGAFLWTTNR